MIGRLVNCVPFYFFMVCHACRIFCHSSICSTFSYHVRGIYVLLQERISTADIAVARDLLTTFCTSYASLYGSSMLTINVHSISDLCTKVEDFVLPQLLLLWRFEQGFQVSVLWDTKCKWTDMQECGHPAGPAPVGKVLVTRITSIQPVQKDDVSPKDQE